MTISIKFNSDFRIFKKDSTHVVEFDNSGITWLTGGNGCGKSTFMQLLRSRRDSLQKLNLKMRDGMEPSVYRSLREVDVTIDGLDQYDNCFFLDTVMDNPTSFENSATAGALMNGGGYEMMHISRGQGASVQIYKFVKNIKSIIGENDDQKNLIVLDEVDEGLDMNNQASLGKHLIPLMHTMYNADVVCISHSIVPMLSCDRNDKVFSFDYQCFMPKIEYINTLVGRKLKFDD